MTRYKVFGLLASLLIASLKITQCLGADHLQYFGFYANAINGLPDVTAEIAPFSNISWIAGDAGDITKIVEAKSLGLKVIYGVQNVFLNGDYALLTNKLDNANYLDKWNAVARDLQPFVSDGTIVAFYPLDEPYNLPKRNGRSIREVRDMLETIAATIKGTFPQVNLAVTFGRGLESATVPLPRNFDWFGFDAYDCWDSCPPSNLSAPELLDRLQSLLPSHNSKLFLVPDTWKSTAGAPNSTQVSNMITLFNKFLNLAQNRNRVIGIFNFIYQDTYDKKGHVFPGAGSIPALKQRLIKVGTKIKYQN